MVQSREGRAGGGGEGGVRSGSSRAGDSSSVWDKLGALAPHTLAWIAQAPGCSRAFGTKATTLATQSRAPIPGSCQVLMPVLGSEPPAGVHAQVPVGCYRVGSSDGENMGSDCRPGGKVGSGPAAPVRAGQDQRQGLACKHGLLKCLRLPRPPLPCPPTVQVTRPQGGHCPGTCSLPEAGTEAQLCGDQGGWGKGLELDSEEWEGGHRG